MSEQHLELPEDEVKSCPGCGSALSYDPDAHALKCPSCGYTEEYVFKERAGEENDLVSLLNHTVLDEMPETLSVHCPACGAESQLVYNTVSGVCPFCKSPIVASSRSRRTLRPQGIVPFAISRELAESQFKAWLKSLWFAPGKLKHVNLHEALQGIYRPIWTFDFLATSHYSGARGDYYYVTKTREVNGKRETYQERHTRWTPVCGTVTNDFDDLVVFASNQMSDSLQRAVGPWSIKSPQRYDEDTVRGYVEENYDLPLCDGLEEAKCQADSTIRSSVHFDIGGDEQRIYDIRTQYSELTYKLLLVPFWCSHYHYNQKDYQFIVNGENGMSSGTRPYSGWKIFIFVLFIAAIIGAIIYALSLQN